MGERQRQPCDAFDLRGRVRQVHADRGAHVRRAANPAVPIRTSDGYFRDNNYFATGWRGDANYGGVADLPASAGGTDGTVALAGEFRRRRLAAALWYYDFTDFARMVYAQGKFRFAARNSLHPYAQAQLAREWHGSKAFEAHGTHLFGQSGATTNNIIWGLNAGVKVRAFDLSAAYNRLQTRGSGAFGGGALVSPYTAGYATDPLFTTSMIRGLVELGPEIANGRVNPGHQRFIYDRMQIAYRF